MPTEKHRINVTVDDWLWDAVEKYRNDKHLMSMSAAAIDLMNLGLNASNQDHVLEQLAKKQGDKWYQNISYAYNKTTFEKRSQTCDILRLHYQSVGDPKELLYYVVDFILHSNEHANRDAAMSMLEDCFRYQLEVAKTITQNFYQNCMDAILYLDMERITPHLRVAGITKEMVQTFFDSKPDLSIFEMEKHYYPTDKTNEWQSFRIGSSAEEESIK